MATGADAESATHRVYEWMRSRVLDGTLAGGTLVSEGEVAEAMKVSRTPVREAFLQLAAEDMLELYPRRGALVVAVTTTELRDVLTARALIEPWAAAQVASRPDRSSLVSALRGLTARAIRALAEGDERGFQEADRDFHQCLLAAAGNGTLATFYSSLRDRQLRGGTLALRNQPTRGTDTMTQHELIADAIDRGDAGAAAAAIRAHVDDTALALGLAPLTQT
jgi:DNA-binding GntR family transcriptional regulator